MSQASHFNCFSREIQAGKASGEVFLLLCCFGVMTFYALSLLFSFFRLLLAGPALPQAFLSVTQEATLLLENSCGAT